MFAALDTTVPTAIGLNSAQWLVEILPADPSFGMLFKNFAIPSAVAFVTLIGVLPGFCEEIMFRGYMQQRSVLRWGSVTGVVVTSIVFALVHVMPLNSIAVFPIGLWFGYIAWRSKSILPKVFCHLCVNSGVNLRRMILKFNEVPEFAQQLTPNIAILIGLVCYAVCLSPSCRKHPDQAGSQSSWHKFSNSIKIKIELASFGRSIFGCAWFIFSRSRQESLQTMIFCEPSRDIHV